MTGIDLDPRASAGVKMLGHTGAKSFQIRYQDDEQPVVWLAVAEYAVPNAFGKRPVPHWEAAGAMDPTTAIMRLCELVIDGGICTHCRRRTVFVPDSDTELLDLFGGCVYAYDPELRKFRRDCEGDSE